LTNTWRYISLNTSNCPDRPLNFLSHFHLAWPDEALVAGGLEGDYYKGLLRGDLPPDLERGVKLHRAIDAYTDAHPRLLPIKEIMPQHLRRYAGILIDLSFDHFLCRHWTTFSDMPQTEFNQAVYRTLIAWESKLSKGSQDMLARLVEYDILDLYNEWNTVTATAQRIGQRFRGNNPLADVDLALTPYRDELEEAFLDFYPELQAFCRAHLQQSAL
jgi:acyl carrier protein phosphodiesterase